MARFTAICLHYSGGIVGQWTNNGGTVEDCYNYGNLQTTYAANWVGASGGIVAQLYHAASGQDFNILSCQNPWQYIWPLGYQHEPKCK